MSACLMLVFNIHAFAFFLRGVRSHVLKEGFGKLCIKNLLQGGECDVRLWVSADRHFQLQLCPTLVVAPRARPLTPEPAEKASHSLCICRKGYELENGSSVKSTSCSRGPGFNSQHPQAHIHLYVTPALEDPTPGLHRHQSHVAGLKRRGL